jgi:hypothetical protein
MSMLYFSMFEHEKSERAILEAMKIRRRLLVDITLDITFLVRLNLANGKIQEALEALVYAMMCAKIDSQDFTDMIYTIAAAFANDQEIKFAFTKAIVTLLERKKLRPILRKWERWEAE